MKLGKISEITTELESYEDRMFISFDIDWCHDDVLQDSIAIIKSYGAPSTWFVTHDTPMLDAIRDIHNSELGIHPNFNKLLSGDFSNGRCVEEVIDRLLELVPEAKSIRAHSLLQSSPISDILASRGLTHECNHFIPFQSKVDLKPWKLWNGIIKVPHFWEDDISMMYDTSSISETLSSSSKLKVFDFHPIHVYINCDSIQKYEATRLIHREPEKLILKRHSGSGARQDLLYILERSITS